MTAVEPMPEMTVAQVLELWPQTAGVFLRLQTACPGCPMARFCSLADLAQDYELALDELMARLRAVVEAPAAGDEASPPDKRTDADASIDDPFEPPRWSLVALLLLSLAAALIQACAPAEESAAPPALAPVAAAGDAAVDDAAAPTPAGLRGFPVVPERPAPDFGLSDPQGRDWHLADARGQVVALFFGYTHCPDVCPQTLNRVRQAYLKLDEAAQAGVTVVMVTVDPERDTAERLDRYLSSFDPRFLGLRGDADAIARAAAAYEVRYEKELPEGASDSSESYTVAHSGSVFLIDASGQMRTTFKGAFTPDEMAQDLRLLLEERRP